MMLRRIAIPAARAVAAQGLRTSVAAWKLPAQAVSFPKQGIVPMRCFSAKNNKKKEDDEQQFKVFTQPKKSKARFMVGGAFPFDCQGVHPLP